MPPRADHRTPLAARSAPLGVSGGVRVGVSVRGDAELALLAARAARPDAAATGLEPAGAGKPEYRHVRFPDEATLAALCAAREALGMPPFAAEPAPEESREAAVVLCTATAGRASAAAFRAGLDGDGPRPTSGAKYVAGLFNTAAATIATELGLRARTLTLCPWGSGELEALRTALDWIEHGRARSVLVGCTHTCTQTGPRDDDPACFAVLAAFVHIRDGGGTSALELASMSRRPSIPCLGLALLAAQARDDGVLRRVDALARSLVQADVGDKAR